MSYSIVVDTQPVSRTIALTSRARTGALHLDFTAAGDCLLARVIGENGTIELAIHAGRIDGSLTAHGEGGRREERRLDAEDALGMADGFPHSLTLAVTSNGTHLYVDGYEAFSTTMTAWFDVLQPSVIEFDPNGVTSVSRFAVIEGELSPSAAVGLSLPAQAMCEFAAARLAPRDARRTGALTQGSIRVRFRTRGAGQDGVIMAAAALHADGVDEVSPPTLDRVDGLGESAPLGENRGTLRIGITQGSLYYRVVSCGEVLAEVLAPGHWDDGDFHDLVVTSGRGATDIYVDGYQVIHSPGTAFFADIPGISEVCAGMDIDQNRLFGEVIEGGIYPQVLSDHQVKRLAGVAPLETIALFDTGYHGAVSFRIPSLLTLKSGVVLAGADKRVSIANDAPNDIALWMRRSLDGGRTWEDAREILALPGAGKLGSSITDSVLVQDRESGRVIAVMDQFRGGIGQPNALVGTGFTEDGMRILHDAVGSRFVLCADGSVVDDSGAPTEYRVAPSGEVSLAGASVGSIFLSPEDSCTPDGCLFQFPTCYLWVVTSSDDGATWSEPRDITAQVKEQWMSFCGASPGNGIQLRCGPHAGRVLVPIYYNHSDWRGLSCAAIYSDDAGTTWHRGESPSDGRVVDGVEVHSRTLTSPQAATYESVLVEGEGGSVHVFARNQHRSGRVLHAVSHDGGCTWGEVEFVEQIPEIFSQPNAIRVNIPGEPTVAGETGERTEPSESAATGREAIVFANASQMLPFRGRGVLRMSLDDAHTWPHNRVFNPRHYVYQCMAQLPDGRIGLLWEREMQGLFFTAIPLEWLTSSRST